MKNRIPAGFRVILLLVIGVMLYSPRDLWALRAALGNDQRAIKELISEAESIQEEIRSLKPADPERAEKARKLARDRDLARTKAAQLALIAYHIVPTNSYGRALMPGGRVIMLDPSYDRKVVWIVTARDNTARPTQSSKGKTEVVPPEKDVNKRPAASSTATDGVTSLFPSAFESPGMLALYLFHEKQHFAQYLLPGKGDVMTGSQREVAAWDDTLTNIEDFGLSEEEKSRALSRIKAIKKFYEGQVSKELLIRKLTGGLVTSAASGYAPPHTEADYNEMRKESVDLGAVAAKELKYAHDKREKMELDRQYSSMFELAERSCKEPGSITQRDLDDLPRVPANNCKNHWPIGHSCRNDLIQWMCSQLAENGALAPEILEEEQKRQEEDRTARHLRLLGQVAEASCKEPGSVTQEMLDWFSDFSGKEKIYDTHDPTNTCVTELWNYALGKLRRGERLISGDIMVTAIHLSMPKVVLPPPVCFDTWGQLLYKIAQAACANPGIITARDVQYLSDCGFPTQQYPDWDDPDKGLSGCSKDLYWLLVEANQTWKKGSILDEAWVNAYAKRQNEKYARQPSNNQPQYKEPPQRPERGRPGCLPPDRNTGIIGCPADRPR